jgi:gluconolactonase
MHRTRNGSFSRKGDGWFWLMPASQPGLALTVDGAGTKNGTKIILAKDNKSDAQLWSLTKQDNGSYALEPKHAPGMGLDHLGGRKEIGAKVDLWQHKQGDQHLQWFIKPLAGSGIAEAKQDDAPGYTPPAVKPEDIKPGRIETFTFTQSKIFPGTVREVTVFIPAQYDASKPRAFM